MSKADIGERALRQGRSPLAGDGDHRHRSRARRRPRQGRIRAHRHQLHRRLRSARLPDHAEGTRRRLPDGPPAPVDPVAAAAGGAARAARGHRRGPRLLQQPRLHPRRHAHLHAVGVRGHDDAVPGAVLRGHHGVPDAERAAVQRGQRDGPRQDVLLRAHVPRREEQDAAASHRVLDGRARGRLRHPRRHDGSRRAPGGIGRGAGARQAAGRARRPRARHVEARDRDDAVPAHLLHGGDRAG